MTLILKSSRAFVFVFLKDNIFGGTAILPKVLVFEFQNKSQRNTWRSFYFLCIECIELMWCNKPLKVSSVQFYYTWLVYIIVFSLFKIKSFSINIYFSLFYPFPSLIIIHFSLSMRIFLSIFSLFLKSFQTHLCWHLFSLYFSQSLFSLHDSVCILFVYFIHYAILINESRWSFSFSVLFQLA